MDETTFEHIDQFIDDRHTDPYASWFFNLYRLSATLQIKFRPYIEKYELYCDYNDTRYLVVGCSRLGDVWLRNLPETGVHYNLRVSINSCSNFKDSI